MKRWLSETLNGLTEWLCWSAWNYARKRAIRRERWMPQEAEQARNDLSLDQRRVYANEAQQVLDNKHFIDAWNAVNQTLDEATLSLNPDNKEQAARIVISKQLLHAVKREMTRKLNDGYMAEVELVELQKRNRPARFER